jgi:hypothetical protein
MIMAERCVLLVGTAKGALLLDDDADRRGWRIIPTVSGG